MYAEEQRVLIKKLNIGFFYIIDKKQRLNTPKLKKSRKISMYNLNSRIVSLHCMKITLNYFGTKDNHL